MTQEDKELLLKDLCARLPYGVKILYTGWDNDRGFEYQVVEKLVGIDDNFIYTLWGREKNKYSIKFADFKPYLRPMSSMTEEEREEFRTIGGIMSYSPQHDTWALSAIAPDAYDWFNAYHFDYRGLIEKGLAIEVTEENNPYKKSDS